MEKKRAFFERLQAVCAHQMQPQSMARAPMIPTSTCHQQLSALSLYQAYEAARDSYFKWINSSLNSKFEVPPVLRYPYFYFYLKSNQIFFMNKFPYGQFKQTNLLSERTFSSFLKNVCEIPYIKSDQCDALYQTLHDYLLKHPREQIDLLINQIRMYSAPTALLMECNESSSFLTLSKQGNLLFSRSRFSSVTNSMVGSGYQPLFSLIDIQPEVFTQDSHPIPTRLLRQYFTLISKRCQKENWYTVPSHPEPNTPCLVFSDSRKTSIECISYHVEKDTFGVQTLFYKNSFFNFKSIANSFEQTSSVSPAIRQFFRLLCGHDAGQITALSEAFDRALAVSEPGITVLYTKHHQTLLEHAITEIFQLCAVPFAKPISLNQLTKSAQLRTAYTAQFEGKSVILVRDLLPSEGNLSKLRRLLRGKSVPLKSNYLPTQKFVNHLQLICVTDQRHTVEFLKNKLKADVLDFSGTEVADSFSLTFSKEDVRWFLTRFSLYGLKLRTLKISKAPMPANSFPAPPDDDWILKRFINECCHYSPGAFSSSQDVYQVYCKYLSSAYPGQDLAMTKICLNKRLRTDIPSVVNRKIEYKRDRSSRKARSIWGYTNLQLQDPPASPPPVPMTENPVDQLLSEISEAPIQFTGGLHVGVIRVKET